MSTKSRRPVVFVTGSNRGIGLGVAKYYDEKGFNVILHSRHNIPNSILSQFEHIIDTAIFDITDDDASTKEISRILSSHQSIDILVNSAGITKDSLFMNMSINNFNDVIYTNLVGTIRIMDKIIPHMIKQHGGSIINISSAIGESGNIGQTNYAASKSAIIDFTQLYARKYAHDEIRINTICPGMINSEMTNNLSEKVKKSAISKIPLKRFGTTLELAQMVMAVSLNTYMTGAIIDVNGGLFMRNNL